MPPLLFLKIGRPVRRHTLHTPWAGPKSAKYTAEYRTKGIQRRRLSSMAVDDAGGRVYEKLLKRLNETSSPPSPLRDTTETHLNGCGIRRKSVSRWCTVLWMWTRTERSINLKRIRTLITCMYNILQIALRFHPALWSMILWEYIMNIFSKR